MPQSLKLSCKGECEYLEVSREKKCCSKLEIERDGEDLWIGIHDYSGKLLGDMFLDAANQKKLIKFLQIQHRERKKEDENNNRSNTGLAA